MNIVPVYDARSGRITSSLDLATGHMGGEVQPLHPFHFEDEGGTDVTAEVYAEAERQAERAEKALEARARKLAQASGYEARKTSWQAENPLVNNGGFQIVDASTGFPVWGWIHSPPDGRTCTCQINRRPTCGRATNFLRIRQ